MDNIIEKTKNLIEVLEGSELIKNLEHYKNKVLCNKEIMNLIDKYNNSNDEYEKLEIKNKIYKYEEYNHYMKYYNKLFYYVLDINSRFKRLTNERRC